MITMRGYGVLFCAIGTGLIWGIFPSRFLLTMCAFFFVTVAFSGIWINFHRKKLTVYREVSPEYIYEDTDVVTTLHIKNANTESTIRDFFDSGNKTISFFLPYVRSDIENSVQYKFHVTRRGAYTIGPLVVRATDALGLFAREYPIPLESELRVYPKISDVTLPQIPLRSSEQSRHMDRNASTLSDDLLGLKEYVMGDDIRLIHWKTSSRTQDLFVRHRERQATLPLVIILDCEERSWADEDEFDSAARLVASLSFASQSQDIPLRLFCNDHGEFIATHPLIMDRLAVTQPQVHIQSQADSSRLLADFDKNYIFVTGSHGELFSSAILTLRIVPNETIAPETFNMIPLRKAYTCQDFTTRIKQWNAHASLQSLS